VFARFFFDCVANNIIGKSRRQEIAGLGEDLTKTLAFRPTKSQTAKKVVLRVDYGDTILRYPQHSFIGFSVDPVTFALTPAQRTLPANTTHNTQFIVGVGFRF